MIFEMFGMKVGRLGKDAAWREPKGEGEGFVSFSMACDAYDYKEKEKVTIWVDVTVNGKRGEAVLEYLTKGKQVGVAGNFRSQLEEYEGEQKLRVRVNAQDIVLCGGGEEKAAKSDKPKTKKKVEDEDEGGM